MRFLFTLTTSLALIGCSEQPPVNEPSLPTPIQDVAPRVDVQSKVQPLIPIENPDLNSIHLVLSEIPKLTLSESPEPKEGNDQIERMIASLAAIESPNFGLSPTLTGTAFLPIEGQAQAGALLLTDHKIESFDALKQLVILGPAALPSLLAHLDDATPTKLKIDHSGDFGSMSFARELDGNPVSRTEQSVLQSRPQDENEPFGGDHVHSYTVKIGDVCFVAIGQITGRGYQAVRYQPSACVVLNSPTHDPALCAQVRAIWQSESSRQKLFDSLLLDYATRGKFNGKSLDYGWLVGSSLQIEAAMRLIYYFPTESAALIADRIDHMDVSRTGPPSAEPASESELTAHMNREVVNGVRTVDFIAATAWSKHPEISAAIQNVALRTNDEDIIKLVSNAR